MIDIVMLTTGRWQFTRLAIEELARRTTAPFRLIVVDGGDSYTQSMLAEMVSDGLIGVAVLLSSGYDEAERWAMGMALAGTGPLVQATDVWLPPADSPDWLETLLAALEQRPEYGFLSLRPKFFPKGVPPMARDGDLLMTPWTETAFRCVRRGASATQDRSAYMAELSAEYVPSSALAWHPR